MAQKKTNDEIRRAIEKEDKSKDVQVCAAVFIAAVAGISSAAGIVAVLSLGFLENYRKDVAAYWLACMPFCFPFITGLATAYRKQLANVGLHIALVMATLLSGGAGYGYSIQPVFIERENCTLVSEARGDCHKEALVYLYVAAGGVAAGFGAIGLLVSLKTCSSATKRRNKRVYEHELRLQREQDKKNREIKHIKQQQAHALPSTFAVKEAGPIASQNHNNLTNDKTPAQTNDKAPAVTNDKAPSDVAASDSTTHL